MPGQGELVLLRGHLVDVSIRRHARREGRLTYSVAPEFCHDCLHGLLILFQEKAELPVFLQEGVVLDDYLRIRPLQFGLEDLCSRTQPLSLRLPARTRRSPFERSTLNLLRDTPLQACAASS